MPRIGPYPHPFIRRPGALFVAALALLACKKNDGEAPAGGYVQGQVGPGGAGAGGAPAMGQGGAAGMVPAAAGAAQGGATATAMQAAGASGMASGPLPQKLDPGAGAVLQPALADLAKKDIQPGSKPIGETLVGNFGPNTSLELPIQLQPNKCYSVIAVGVPPVAEVALELQLTTVVPGMAPVLAVDQDSGATAVLGRKPNCYKWMFGVIPAPAKVIVRVTSGSGLVVAQAYEK